MEPFEPIRNAAGELHAELVGTGHDALQPMALVNAAVNKLDVELRWLEADDPALKGGQALFDDQSGTILCARSDEPAICAEVAAHEIGHAVLHSTSTSCLTHDIDPSRSTEAAPVGLQRVEDYGVRERRELQANVFAREFLFPRSLARHLFVEEFLGASDIAQRIGLPLNLVRQQLFDALLLPPAQQGPTAPPHAQKPDSSQDRAAEYDGSAFQLQAGPGTGKTRTLEKRVKWLLSQNVDPAAILILTFSNRAAGELADRLAASQLDTTKIWIGTFHAFGLDLLRRHHGEFGLSSNPTLFDRSDAIAVLEEILPTLPLVHYRNLWDPTLVLREIVAAISRSKDEMTDPVRYRSLAQTMLTNARDKAAVISAQKCLEIATVYELYQEALRKHDGIDFGDLIMLPALLLEKNATLREVVRVRHRHVLVDEYQDVNRASGRLLKVIAGDGERLWVVGDSLQSIYRFRGASSVNMAAFSTEYPNAKAGQLSINYRSTPEIVRALITASGHMGASDKMLPLNFAANRKSLGVSPQLRRYDSLDDEASGVAANIRELEAAGVRLRDQAVLCRGHKRLNEMAAVLESHGIAVLHLGSLFERPETRDLLSILTLAIGHFGDGLARVGAMQKYGLSLQDTYVATRHLRDNDARFLIALPTLSSIEGLSAQGRSGLNLLAQDFDGISSSTSAWEFLATYLLDRSTALHDLAQAKSIQETMRAIAVWQFLNFVREHNPAGSGAPIQRTLDRVRQLVLLAEERDLRQIPAAAAHIDAVRLMTVHGSKGLEFEAIHLPGMTVSSFPLSNRGQRCPPPEGMIEDTEGLTVPEEFKLAHELEEECLFFVALSRARTYLHLYLSRFQPNGKTRTPSPFLDWLPATILHEVANPATLQSPSALGPLSAVTVINSHLIEITGSRLGSYAKCPRRFFYTHVLGLGSAKKATAFSRTHDCLYDLIRWLADARLSGDPTIGDAEKQFQLIWEGQGPTDHAFSTDYRSLASSLIGSLIRSGAGRRFRNSEPLAIDLANGRVLVEPDEVADLPDGTVVLRRVNTGRKRTDEYDRIEYALYKLAGEAHFGTGFTLQALHLSDDTIDTVTLTSQKLNNRRSTTETMLRDIGTGSFPTEVDSVTCPRCPHFFICPQVPTGTLTLQ